MRNVTYNNDNSVCLHFLTMFPDQYTFLHFGDTLWDYRTGQRGVSHASMKK